jgi:hypothetical protein
LSTKRFVLVAVLLGGCAHRYPLASPEPRQAISGVKVTFGDSQAALPAGTSVRWELSDGARAEGPTLSHAFPFAGEYSVTEIVTDADGERRSQLPVTVARRSPMMAVPPGAEQALCLDHFWNRFPVYRAVLGRALGSGQLDEALDRMQESLGLDPRQPEALKAAGIDLDEGLCWVSFPEEREGHYLVVGTSDDVKSGATLRAWLLRGSATFEDGPEGFVRANLPGASDAIYFRHERGYLVIRVPGEHPEPPLALGAFARAPDTGLLEVQPVQGLRSKLLGGDVQLFMARSALVSPETLRADDLGQHVKGLFGTFSLAEDTVSGTALLALDPQGTKPLAALFPAGATAPALPDHASAGAALYLSFPGDARALFSGLFGSRHEGKSRLQESLSRDGLDVQTLMGLFDRGAAIAAYFDQAEYYRGLIDTQVPMPRGEVLVEGRVARPELALGTLQQLITTSHTPPTARKQGAGTRLDFLLGGHPAGAFIGSDALVLSYGLKHFDALLGEGKGPRLASQLRAALPPEALQPGQLLAYLDVAQVIDHLAPEAPIPGTAPEQLMRAQLFTRVAAGPFAPIRDVLAVAAPAPEGLRISLRLRLR